MTSRLWRCPATATATEEGIDASSKRGDVTWDEIRGRLPAETHHRDHRRHSSVNRNGADRPAGTGVHRDSDRACHSGHGIRLGPERHEPRESDGGEEEDVIMTTRERVAALVKALPKVYPNAH